MILFCENREQNSLGAICVLPASIVMCEAIIKLFALACKQKVKLKNKNILRIGSLCSCVNQSLSFPIVPPYPIENFKIWRKKTERNKINSITFSKTTDSTKDHHTHAFWYWYGVAAFILFMYSNTIDTNPHTQRKKKHIRRQVLSVIEVCHTWIKSISSSLSTLVTTLTWSQFSHLYK